MGARVFIGLDFDAIVPWPYPPKDIDEMRWSNIVDAPVIP